MSCVEQGFTFKSPLSILVVEPSNCGKTTFLKRLLLENEDLLVTPPQKDHLLLRVLATDL